MDDLWEGIGGIFVVILLIYGGSYLYHKFISEPFKEVTGTVKFDDCREQITLNSSEYEKQTGTFLCNDIKTNSGKSMGGECVRTIIDSSNQCQTAYVFEKPPEETCASNSHVTVNDTCACDYGYEMSGGTCISHQQSCQDSFGVNSYSSYDTKSDSYLCYCNSGYMWNSSKTSCIPFSLY